MKHDLKLIFVVIVSKIFRIFLKNRRDQEILLLRKEIQLLHRKVGKPNLNTQNRLFFIALLKANPKSIGNAILFKPKTIMKWHKNLVARKWDYSERRKGRPPLTDEIKNLIIEMKTNNKRWGCRKIRGELKKLKIKVGKTTIWRILCEAGFDPEDREYERTWINFLHSHGKRFFSCDFITVETLFLKRLYLFSVMDVSNREIIGYCVTRTPNIIWLENVLRSIFAGIEDYPKILVTDRDRLFGKWLENFLDGYEMRLLRTPPKTPNCNSHIERWHRTLREELLDHCLIYGKRDLERLVSDYLHYYHNHRPHQGLNNNAPKVKFSNSHDKIVPKYLKRKMVDGMITNYSLAG